MAYPLNASVSRFASKVIRFREVSRLLEGTRKGSSNQITPLSAYGAVSPVYSVAFAMRLFSTSRPPLGPSHRLPIDKCKVWSKK